MSRISRLRTSLFLLAMALLLSGAPASFSMIPPDDDFILCTCKLCNSHPDVECQISPSGYTILCSDYARLHNC
jgi:hypothetical protein